MALDSRESLYIMYVCLCNGDSTLTCNHMSSFQELLLLVNAILCDTVLDSQTLDLDQFWL